VTFTKNPDYWGYDEKYPENRLPYVDELRATVILDEATISAALRSGKLDYRQSATDVDSVLSLKRTNPEIAAHPIMFRSGSSFALNHREAPFNDINVRHAMQMALDNENIAATYWKGQADATPQGAVGVIGYHIPFDEWPAEVKQYYTYDPEAAEKLLDEAGYPRGADGERFKTSVIVLDTGSSYAEIAASYWAAIGVDVEVEVLARTEFLALRNPGNFEGMAQSEAGSLVNPVDVVGNFSSDSMMNFGKSEWTEMDAMVDAALGATTIEEQARLIAEVDMYAVEKHWQIFGPKSPQYQIAQPWLIGFNGELALNKWEDYLTFSRLWIDSDLKEAMGY
jgi:peptide/nickel transport system substrate-binding protein